MIIITVTITTTKIISITRSTYRAHTSAKAIDALKYSHLKIYSKSSSSPVHKIPGGGDKGNDDDNVIIKKRIPGGGNKGNDDNNVII